MLKGEDIRKLSDVDLEFYVLGVEEMERERDKLLKEIKELKTRWVPSSENNYLN